MKASDISQMAADIPFEPTLTGRAEPDQLRVSQNDKGDILVTDEQTGNVLATYAANPDRGIDLDLGDGDDSLTIDGNVQARLRIHGGSGNDTITANDSLAWLQVFGDEGNDALTGDSAIDASSGREGAAQLFGGNGDDVLTGGDGADFLRGGQGADRLQAGDGTDAIYSDTSDSLIDAGADKKVDLVVGEGSSPAATGLDPSDVVVGSNIAGAEQYLADHPQLKPDAGLAPENTEILKTGLGVMLGTESGKGLLDSLVQALEKEKGEFISLVQSIGLGGQYWGEPGFGSQGYIPNLLRTGTALFPNSDGVTWTPPDVLYHEFVHAYQDLVADHPGGKTTFTAIDNPKETVSVANSERQAAGLPWIDEQGTYQPGDTLPFTQNKFRKELGLPEATHYHFEIGDPLQDKTTAT